MKFFIYKYFWTATFFLTGCFSVGPDYTPPEKQIPESFSLSSVRKDMSDMLDFQAEDSKKSDVTDIPVKQVSSEMLADWWNALEDPLLTELVNLAIRNNLDLKIAQSRLREERAQRGIAQAGFFPTIGALTSTNTQKIGSGKAKTLYSSSFDASWEIDIFGGIRRSVESADASVEARQEELNDTLVTLVAEVALNYIEIRSFQARLDAAEKNMKTQEETLKILQDRLNVGLTNTLSVNQAKYNLETTRSEIPSLQTGIKQGKNGLAVLLGGYPGSVDKKLEEYIKIPVTPVEIAVGVPADLLRRRPDIRVAERELAAQTAQIGVATAELYPKLFLVGSVGLESLSAGSFFSGPTTILQAGPKITWNIFTAGRIRQNIKVENERQNQALIQYEASILNAVKDVEDALIDFANEQARRESLVKATNAATSAARLSRETYTAGLNDFIEVLDAERALFSLQDQLAVSEARVTSNLIRLYKSLGGGWKPYMEGTI